jgi:hypothetical protein
MGWIYQISSKKDFENHIYGGYMNHFIISTLNVLCGGYIKQLTRNKKTP